MTDYPLRDARKVCLVATLFICLSVLLPACVSQESHESNGDTQTRLESIRQAGLLRVGTTGDFIPFSYWSEGQSNLNGIDIELARDLADSLDVDVRFVETSWPTLIDDLRADHFDIGMSGITITVARKEYAYFSESMLQSGKVAIARDENASRFETLAGINQPQVRVIVNPGGTNEAFARANFPLSTIIVNKDNVSIFDNLVLGAADVMVTDAVEAVLQERIHPELEVANPNAPFNQFEFGYLLPHDTEWKAFVDVWLNQRKQAGTVQCLINRELERVSATKTAVLRVNCE